MKINTNNLLFLLITGLLLLACEAAPPENRPNIFGSQNNIGNDGDEDTTEPVVELPSRPSGAVTFPLSPCGCQNGAPITVGGACENFCSNNSNDGVQTLHIGTNLTTAITENPNFENLTGWCLREINNPETGIPIFVQPSCVVEAMDQNGLARDIGPPVILADNSIRFDITTLEDDITYRVRLKVVEGENEAESETFQVRKFSQVGGNNITGPLQLVPINRYACGIRNGGSTSVDADSFTRFHLFFNAETRPDPLRAETIGGFFCHDLGPNAATSPLPPTNSPLFDETPGVFTLWDRNDPRFFDQDGELGLDIHQIIQQRANLLGNTLSEVPNLFAPLTWLSAFDDGDEAPGGTTSNDVSITNANLGFIMRSFLGDADDRFRAFCPKMTDFEGNDPLFSAMQDTVATDTEALYVAKRVNVCDFILVNESTIRQIWFYEENGLRIRPTEENIQGKRIQFFWPADLTSGSPFTQKGGQQRYTVNSTEEISGTCTGNDRDVPVTDDTLRTSIPAHDKRIGCIPMLGSGQ